MKGQIRPGRAPGTWYLRVELERGADGKRRRRRETFTGTKAEAQKRLRSLLVEIDTGGFADAGRATIAELLDQWVASTEHRVGVKTYKRYSAIVRLYLKPAIGSIKAEALRPAHVEAALAKWIAGARHDGEKRGLSPRSIKHIFDALKTAGRWAVRMGILTRNPAAAVEPPKVESPEMKSLDAAGVAKLLRATEGTELHLPVLVAIGTGLRLGELLALRWSDVDLDAGRLSVRRSLEVVGREVRTKPPKTTRSARTITIAPTIVDALRAQRAEQNERRLLLGLGRDEDGWIIDRADCSVWNPAKVSFAFAQFVKNADVPKVRFHDLRHSHATLALAAGTDLKTISAMLGHSTIAVTANTYLHAVEALQRDHANRVDSVLRGALDEAVSMGSGPQRAHARPTPIKKARRSELSVVAPTGIEPVFSP